MIKRKTTNYQNFPSRESKYIRNILVAPDNHYLVACDQGQIEARVIAMVSLDKVWIDQIWNDFDIHLHWAEQLVEILPSYLDRYEGDYDKKIKQIRKLIKNAVVFPLFYGAGIPKISMLLDVDIEIGQELYNRFWGAYKVAKEWQKSLLEFYNKNYYVESPAGRRRYGPISVTEVLDCVDDETTLLSTKGWKRWDELEVGENIFTYNKDTSLLEINPIQKLNIFHNVNSELHEFTSRSFSALTTPNHRWCVDTTYLKKFVTSSELCTTKTTQLIPRCGTYISPITNSSWTDNEIKLIGWLLTDGHYIKQRKKSNTTEYYNDNRLVVIQNKIENLKEIEEIFSSFGDYKHYNYARNKYTHVYTLYGDVVRKIKKTFPKKILTSEFLLSLPNYQLKLLFDTMLKGDGHIEKSGRIRYWEGSQEAIDMFAFLCVLLGLPVSVFKRDISKRKLPSIDGRVINSKCVYEANVLSHKNTQNLFLRETIKQNLNKTMWCPTVKNDTFIAKRNGKVYITGNSPIQSAASDIVIESGNRLSYEAYRLKKPQYQYVLNIHDDETFYIPDDTLEEDIIFMAREMVKPVFDFINVPLSVEVSIGRRWGELEEIAKFNSTEFFEYKNGKWMI